MKAADRSSTGAYFDHCVKGVNVSTTLDSTLRHAEHGRERGEI